MQSKTSSFKYFNKTLFRKNLTRYWPLWGFASFAGALFPLAMLLQLIRNNWIFSKNAAVRPLEATQLYYNVLTYAVPIISLIYAVLCAMAVWNYLYNARSTGLMHTLPIRREGLFFTNLLSGLAMMVIPYAVTGTLAILVTSAYGGFEPVGLAVTILGVLGDSLCFFGLATLCAFLTSNLFMLPALYFLLNFLAVLLDWLVNLFAQGFIFGLSSSYYSGAVEWLSPVVYLIDTVWPDSQYREFTPPGEIWATRELVSVTLEKGWLIAAYAAAGLVCLAAAFLLYRRRANESAGDVVAARSFRPVFRYGVTALAALLGGQALYALFWGGFQSSQYTDLLPMAVSMTVAGLIGYYGASMLLSKSLRVFRRSIPGAAAVVLGCVLVCCALRFDVFGAAARVPDADDIQRLELSVANNSYTLYPGEDAELLEQVRQVHQAIVADEDHYRSLEMDRAAYLMDQDGTYEGVYLTYVLKDGGSVKRYYDLYLTRDRMARAGTADNLLDRLVNSPEMKQERLRLRDSHYTVEGGGIYLEARQEGFDLNSREAQKLLNAVSADAESGAWGDYRWFGDDEKNRYAVSLDISFSVTWEEDESGRGWDSIDIQLRPGMEHTITCLKEMGLLLESDLVTYGELHPEWYEETAYGEWTVSPYGEAVFAETLV